MSERSVHPSLHLHDFGDDDELDEHPDGCICPECEQWAMREMLIDAESEHAIVMGEIIGTWPGEPDDGFEAAIDEHRHGVEGNIRG